MSAEANDEMRMEAVVNDEMSLETGAINEISVGIKMVDKIRNNMGINMPVLLLAGMLFLLCSCEDRLLRPDPEPAPLAIFDQLWNDVNDRYSYLALKNVNWDSIGTVFRERIDDGTSDTALFRNLGDMLFELRDGHVNLTSDFNRSRNWEWFLDYPNNYDQELVERFYLGEDHFITGPLLNQVIDSVLYINYRSFGSAISGDHIDELMERANGMKGVIIDVRSNGGGNLNNGYRLASCFTDTARVFAFQRYKTGPGPEEFTTWGKMSIEPGNGTPFEGPVVVLTNRRSYSASTFFAQMMRVIPQVTLMGDSTGGGGGIPVYGELPNGWTYRFSATQTVTPDGEHIELAVPPDIRVDMDPEAEENGVDSIIEAALAFLR